MQILLVGYKVGAPNGIMTRLKTGEGPPCIFEGFPVEQCIVWGGKK